MIAYVFFQSFENESPTKKKRKLDTFDDVSAPRGFTKESPEPIICEPDFNLKIHIQSIHEKKRHQCEFCEKSYLNKNNLDEHIKSVHYGHMYDCEFCDNTYKTKRSLANHIKTLHEGQRQKCIFCGTSYDKITDLQRHINDIHFKAVNENQDIPQSESLQQLQDFNNIPGTYL